MGVFRTYDIRGVYGTEIDENLAYRIGRACARHLGVPRMLGGFDARLHSRQMYQAFARGAQAEGVEVDGTGLASTPYLHFAQMRRQYPAGFMATASHNPPEYHGFKLFDGTGASISYAKGLDRVEELVAGIQPERPDLATQTVIPPVDALAEYVEFVTAHASRDLAGMRVVVDTGNGSSGAIFQATCDHLGLDATVLNAEPDGRFPNHPPNPLEATSQTAVADAVRAGSAVCGVVVDGDGDRLIVCDEHGRMVESYFLGALISQALLKRHPGAAIVYDVISSRVLPEVVTAAGGNAQQAKVGYTFIYDSMVQHAAVFGVETSGHVYFRVTDSYFTESTCYALTTLLSLLAESGKPLSELVDPLRGRYAQSDEINLALEGGLSAPQALQQVEDHFAGGQIDRLDGVSISFPDFWFTLRASNTEPLLRLRLEGTSAAVVEQRVSEIMGLLERRS